MQVLKQLWIFPLFCAVGLPNLTRSEENKELYATYCSACHGEKGQGSADGTNPPLAGSLWVGDNGARATSIVLHGLSGEVHVQGKEYNLMMPPQGEVLNDAQIASVLSYIRSSWGNKFPAVSAKQVAAVRKKHSQRSKPWTAKELSKLYPLPKANTSPITDLIRTTYAGKWSKLPDFSRLEGTSIEEEHDGLLNLRNIKQQDHFGVVWEGKLHVPKDGTYTIWLDSDDESRVIIGGVQIASIRGLGPLNSAKRRKLVKVSLKQGITPIRVEFFEYMGGQGIHLGWSGPGIKGMQWMSEQHPSKQARKPRPVIDLTPTGKESVIYNNFLNKTTPRSLAVGHPNGANFAFSTSQCSLDLIWSGKFINASQHWISRGVGRTDPYGEHAISLGSKCFDEDVTFKGYTLDARRRPTFKYKVGAAELTDAIMPGKEKHQLIRTITVKGKQSIKMAVAKNIVVKQESSAAFLLDNKWKIETGSTTAVAEANSLTVVLKPGTHTIIYTLKR